MSDYLWQLEQNADQKENILEYRRVSFRMLDPDEVRRREYRRMRKVSLHIYLLLKANTQFTRKQVG